MDAWFGLCNQDGTEPIHAIIKQRLDYAKVGKELRQMDLRRMPPLPIVERLYGYLCQARPGNLILSDVPIQPIEGEVSFMEYCRLDEMIAIGILKALMLVSSENIMFPGLSRIQDMKAFHEECRSSGQREFQLKYHLERELIGAGTLIMRATQPYTTTKEVISMGLEARIPMVLIANYSFGDIEKLMGDEAELLRAFSHIPWYYQA